MALVRSVAVGMPPSSPETSPLSLVDWVVVIVGLELSLYVAVRLVTWLDVKIGSIKLLHDISRELGDRSGHPPGGDGGS